MYEFDEYYDNYVNKLKDGELYIINAKTDLKHILNYMVKQELPEFYGPYKTDYFIMYKIGMAGYEIKEEMYKDFIKFSKDYQSIYDKSLMEIYPTKKINCDNVANNLDKENVEYFIKNIMHLVRDSSMLQVNSFLQRNKNKNDHLDSSEIILSIIDITLIRMFYMFEELRNMNELELSICLKDKKTDIIYFNESLYNEFTWCIENDEDDWMFKYSKFPKSTNLFNI